MTPHHHWLRNYTPYRVPIRLADHNTIYSAGVGTVVFHPVIDGKSVRPVEFSRVLHVPDLRNNLLSVLYLTHNSGFHVTVGSSRMSFQRPAGTTLFVAPISSSNAAFLDGSTIPLSEYASAATTIPLDIDLWHRRLAHHHLAGVKTLIDHDMVTGLKLDSKTMPDPIFPYLSFSGAENQSERKLKILRDDKGGEYMSNAFLDFTTQCGIERQHTTLVHSNSRSSTRTRPDTPLSLKGPKVTRSSRLPCWPIVIPLIWDKWYPKNKKAHDVSLANWQKREADRIKRNMTGKAKKGNEELGNILAAEKLADKNDGSRLVVDCIWLMLAIDGDTQGTVASLALETEQSSVDVNIRFSLGTHTKAGLSRNQQHQLIIHYQNTNPQACVVSVMTCASMENLDLNYLLTCANFHNYIILNGRRVASSSLLVKASNSIIQVDLNDTRYVGQVAQEVQVF
ncbi:hypothetical protein DFH29DRAFT_995086 [Suillus ampliporus]|nr:hypothetical protein DFH29DRAFT_995086 [Suillus ampliporus]